MERMIDANINRICEGLRVIEDFLRFELNDSKYISRLKNIRHYIRETVSNAINDNKIKKRDAVNDPGKAPSDTENNRKTYLDLVKANFYRVEEGLRVLEETFKLKNNDEIIKTVKSFRFEIYDIEKQVLLILKKTFPDN